MRSEISEITGIFSQECQMDQIRELVTDLNNFVFCMVGNAELLGLMDLPDSAKKKVRAILDTEPKVSQRLHKLSILTSNIHNGSFLV